jgi:hypothetical protein
VRGDSLRDFYAKTLAVLGLGLIAGAGAIVDYWPTGIRLPPATSPAIARITPPSLIQNLNQQVPDPTPVVAPVPERLVTARHVRWPAFAARAQARGALVRSAAFTPASPTTLAEPAASAPPVSNTQRPVSYVVPVSDWAPELLASSRVDPDQLDAGLADSPAPTGFIGGALKRTKDSLVKTGAVTSASLGSAVRGVVGAFKRVSPF